MPAADGKSDQIMALARGGLRPSQIAPRLGMTVDAVTSRLYYYRSRGHDVPTARRGADTHRRLVIMDPPADLAGLLEPYAATRGQTVGELCLEMLVIIARDQMMDTILKDKENEI